MKNYTMVSYILETERIIIFSAEENIVNISIPGNISVPMNRNIILQFGFILEK